MIQLNHKMTLEFYDVPQVFVATDCIGTNYLCVLYSQDIEYHYLAVQVSHLRLQSYLAGQLDLRNAYTDPEQENALYDVVVKDESISVHSSIPPSQLTEDMLPAPGFYHNVSDAIDSNTTDIMELCIPVADRSLLANMARRMGWIASSLRQGMPRVAVF